MSQEQYIYDRFGRPILLVNNSGDIYLFDGQNIGFQQGAGVYNYRGKQVAWLENGVLRDLAGNTAGFNDNPQDFPSPFFPIAQITPIPRVQRIPPIRPVTEIERMRPLKTFQWSSYDPISLFGSRK